MVCPKASLCSNLCSQLLVHFPDLLCSVALVFVCPFSVMLRLFAHSCGPGAAHPEGHECQPEFESR
eukprot:scaffold162091_cov18-Tisochrysis_lutea.AAC.1